MIRARGLGAFCTLPFVMHIGLQQRVLEHQQRTWAVTLLNGAACDRFEYTLSYTYAVHHSRHVQCQLSSTLKSCVMHVHNAM